MEAQDRPADHDVFRSLSDARRRCVLRLLQDRRSPVDLRDLATQVVAAEGDRPLVSVRPYDVATVVPDLAHDHLPLLETAGLVRWDRDAGTVVLTDHPALGDPKFQHVVASDDAEDDWDAVLAQLADERRRIVLSAVVDHDGPVSRDTVARAALARAPDLFTGGTSAEPVEAIETSLHHVHLPKLQSVGLVSYDREDGTVVYEDHAAIETEWLTADEGETTPAILPTARDANAVWTIQGRDNVVARGQSLFEQADEELFLMFTTEGLLEEGCLRRLEDAIDRGVEVYLGSQTPEVRDLVRERVPEAVIWEPQMDWLNLPPEYEKVGRLVFADREAVMLATLGEETERGIHRETAITGTGADNAVVVLLRDMLGSRLDHLDAQSEDFLGALPL